MEAIKNIHNTPIPKYNSPIKLKNNGHSCNAMSFNGNAKTYVVGETTQKIIEWVGKRSTPFNRFLLGATALMLQPFIDLHNKDVDKETKKISAARTIAKAIAGTTTGIIIRWGCIKSIKAMTQTPEDLAELEKQGIKPSKWSTVLTPSTITHEDFGKALRLVKKHRETLGSLIALGVMLFTNFLIDAPVTKFLTNKIFDKHFKNENESQKAKGGNK